MSDAIEAAALAMYFDPRSAQRNRDMAERAIAAAAPIIEAAARADERAKVSEEIAKAIETMPVAREHQSHPKDCVPCIMRTLTAEAHAAIARQHAIQGSARPQEAPDGPDAYPSEGPAVTDAHRAAQTDDRQEQ